MQFFLWTLHIITSLAFPALMIFIGFSALFEVDVVAWFFMLFSLVWGYRLYKTGAEVIRNQGFREEDFF